MLAKAVFVLVDRRIRLDPPAVLDAIRQRHPGTTVEDLGGGSIIRCAEHSFALICVPVRLPLESGLAALSFAGWPEVERALRRHRTHLVVVSPNPGHMSLESARAATAIIGGLIATVPGCSTVVWGKVAHPAARWLDESAEAFAPFPHFPSQLWVGLHPFRSGTGAGIVSSGLQDFIGREIETEGHPADLPDMLDRMALLAAWLIQRGSAVDDGDTFATGARERVTVHHLISRRFPGLPVLFARPAR